jgi:formate hydrogenlyase subunit 4
VVAAATPLIAGTLIPFGSAPPLISFSGDLVLFAYLFALARFFIVLAALDTGSPFEGMGAAREATFSCLAEPALFLGLLALVRTSGSLSLSTMLGVGLGAEWTSAGASLLMVMVSLFIVILAECSRIPVDDPATHLELTMIHEVMVLDHSGPALALIEYGAAAKLFILGALVTRIAIPYSGGNVLLNWTLFLAGMSILAVIIGVVESVMARLRLVHVPGLLVGANLLSGFGIVLLAR